MLTSATVSCTCISLFTVLPLSDMFYFDVVLFTAGDTPMKELLSLQSKQSHAFSVLRTIPENIQYPYLAFFFNLFLWLLTGLLHFLGRWRHQGDQHYPRGQGGLREGWCLSVWTSQSFGTGILRQGNTHTLSLLFPFSDIFSPSFALSDSRWSDITGFSGVLVVLTAGLPGTKGDPSRCQPAICHEGPQEGHTQRYKGTLWCAWVVSDAGELLCSWSDTSSCSRLAWLVCIYLVLTQFVDSQTDSQIVRHLNTRWLQLLKYEDLPLFFVLYSYKLCFLVWGKWSDEKN